MKLKGSCQLFLLILIILEFGYCIVGRRPNFAHIEGCGTVENGCRCFRRSQYNFERPNATQCCCVGASVTVVPQNLTEDVNILDIYDAENLNTFNSKSVSKLEKLKKLSIQNCHSLREIHGAPLLKYNPHLLSLILKNNGLSSVPQFKMPKDKSIANTAIDLSHNEIEQIKSRDFTKLSVRSLDLSFNQLKLIENNAFQRSTIVHLKISDNPTLKHLEENAFKRIKSIVRLDISRTSIPEMPHVGLKNLEFLVARECWALKKMPDVLYFTSLKAVKLTYPYHCCYFKHVDLQLAEKGKFRNNFYEIGEKHCTSPPTVDIPTSQQQTTEGAVLEQTTEVENFGAVSKRVRRWSSDLTNFFLGHTGTWGDYVHRKQQKKSKNGSKSVMEPTSELHAFDVDPPPFIFDDTDEDNVDVSGQMAENADPWMPGPVEEPRIVPICRDSTEREDAVRNYYRSIKCYPEPNALNPCEDITGYIPLRIIIWIVWISAILGNLVVLLVLFVTRHRTMRVHYFLMINLAFADLCTGIYLAMLAIQDLRTAGRYYNYAVSWQTGLGCKMAGFLSVFASELSIITMFLISFDAWYNTKYAFFGKFFRLQAARVATAMGWAFSIFMAVLPLVGISDYSVTSTCLPLDVDGAPAKIYIIAGLIVNIVAFLAISGGYLGIYCMINQSSATCEFDGATSGNPEDIQVAKKMAILILTDFLCWAPTIIFGMTAAAGKSLINISVAKIFLVVFYPINSCANPFLYVFFTKVFRKDMSRLVRKHEWMQTVFSAGKHSKVSRSKTDQFYYYQSHPQGDGAAGTTSGVTMTTSASKRTSLTSTPRGSYHSLQRNSLHLPLQPNFFRANVHKPKSSPTLNLQGSESGPNFTTDLPLKRSTIAEVVTSSNSFQDRAEVNCHNRIKNLGVTFRPRFTPQMSDISEHSYSNSSNSNEDDSGTNHRSRAGTGGSCREVLQSKSGVEKPVAGGSAPKSRYMSDLRTVVEEEKRFGEAKRMSEDGGVVGWGGRLMGARNLWRRSSESSQSSWRTISTSSSALSSDVSGSQKFGGSTDSQMTDNISLTSTPLSGGFFRRNSSDQRSLDSGYSTSLPPPTPTQMERKKTFELSNVDAKNYNEHQIPAHLIDTVTSNSCNNVNDSSSEESSKSWV